MKRLVIIFFLGLSFMISSCSLGLVAVHQEFPCICFKAKCREMEKLSKKGSAHIVNSGKRSANLNSSRKKHKKSKSGKSSKTKKSSKKARFN